MLYVAAPLHVVAAAESVGTRKANVQEAPFLTTSLSNATPYVGEEITIHYTLYFQEIAPKIVRESQPSMQGLWAQASNPDRFINSKSVQFKGKAYRSAVIKSYRVAPLQSGQLPIDGYTMHYVLSENEGEGEKSITAPSVAITARPLPQPIPQGYSGAVGTFSIAQHSSAQQVRVGEPLTVTLTINGTGNLFTVTPPTLSVPASFRADTPNKKIEVNSDANAKSGSITLTQTIWAEQAGSFTLPACSFIAFNPNSKSFATLRTEPLTIIVTPALQSGGQSASKGDSLSSSMAASEDGTAASFPVIPAVAGALIVIMAGVGAWLLRHRKGSAQTSIEGSVPKSSVAITARSAKEQLFAQLHLVGIKHPNGLTRSELLQALCTTRLSPEMQQQFMALLDALDALLYAPGAANPLLTPELAERFILFDKELNQTYSAS